jgi:uncharacterized membrane protein
MISRNLLPALVVLVMGGGGIAHLLQPTLFTGFIFPPLPPVPTVIAAGLVQIVIAVMAIVPRTRSFAGLAFALLCTGYVPLHVWDLFRDDPMISPLPAAVIRIVVQLLFIWAGVSLWRKSSKSGGFVQGKVPAAQ